MGFLDRKSRVIDVVLTERGRRLYADGALDLAYVSFFDDGIDYDPWSTGSLTDDERDALVYSTPMLEAHVVPDRGSALLPLEPTSQVFGAAPGELGVPRMLAPTTGSLVELRCIQSPVDGGYVRSDTTFAEVALELSAGALPSEGFSVHVYSSGSAGLTELSPRRDLAGRRALDPFIALSVDAEAPVDRPSQAPDTRRNR